PPRCTTTISNGISRITARHIASTVNAIPGPEVVVTASDPPYAAPIADEIAAISSSAWKVRTPKFLWRLNSCRISDAGVMGYEPKNNGKPDFCEAATKP